MTGYQSKRAAAQAIDKVNWADHEPDGLVQPEQEPVAHFGSAYVNENGVHITTVLGPVAIPQDAKLYTTPHQRPWVDLTNEEISALSKGHMTRNGFARNVLAKSKERNA